MYSWKNTMTKEYFMIKGQFNLYVSRDEKGLIEDLRNPENNFEFLKINSIENRYSCNLKDYNVIKASKDDLEWEIDREIELEGYERFFNETSKEGPRFCFDQNGIFTTVEEMQKSPQNL